MDGLGYPLVLELTGGQVHDGIMLQNCLDQLDISGSTVLADKAYGSWENREYIANHDADFCIPPKSNSVDPWYTDFYHYKERHLVECFFMKLKEHQIGILQGAFCMRYMVICVRSDYRQSEIVNLLKNLIHIGCDKRAGK